MDADLKPRVTGLRAYWTSRLRALLASRRISILPLARAIHDARQELSAAEWDALWNGRRLLLSRRRAELLAAFGRELAGFSERDSARLLAHWTGLYEVALLGGNAVVRLMSAGVIGPDLRACEGPMLASARSNQRVAKAIDCLRSASEQCSLLSRNGRSVWAASLKRLSRAMLTRTK